MGWGVSGLEGLPLVGLNVADVRAVVLAKNPGLDWPEWLANGATIFYAGLASGRRWDKPLYVSIPAVVRITLRGDQDVIRAIFWVNGIMFQRRRILRTKEEAEAACRILNGDTP